jgi:hypothetical protein
MPQNHEVPPADANRKRSTPGRLATVAATLVAAASLVVAVGAWLQPDLPGWICTITDHRGPGCSDVPDEFLGKWSGPEQCHSQALVVCVDQETPVTVLVERGRKGQPVVTTTTGACESRWTLTDAHGLTLNFRTESRPTKPGLENPALPDAPTGCPTGLLATLQLDTTRDTLDASIRSGADPASGLPVNIELFTASLRKT